MTLDRALKSPDRSSKNRGTAAFTLIEIMIVVALMALICTTAVPAIYQLAKKEGLRRAVSDLKTVCENARAQAIWSGKEVSVVFYPQERKFGISGGGASYDPMTGETTTKPIPGSNGETTGIIPDDVNIEMLYVQHQNAEEYEWARVRFYPNGTSEELTVNFSSAKTKPMWLKLDPATATLIVGEAP